MLVEDFCVEDGVLVFREPGPATVYPCPWTDKSMRCYGWIRTDFAALGHVMDGFGRIPTCWDNITDGFGQIAAFWGTSRMDLYRPRTCAKSVTYGLTRTKTMCGHVTE